MKAEHKTITFNQAIEMGDNKIHEVQVCKANVGHLRGISLSKLFALETDELIKLLPRITQPSLPAHLLQSMDISDFTLLVAETVNFLAPTNIAIPNE